MDDALDPPSDPSGRHRLYRDANVLQRCYHQHDLSLRAIADRLGCSATTVHEWMERHDIERRAPAEHKRLEPAHFRTHQGYERWYTTVDGTTRSVLVHRLLAVAEVGFDAVRGNHVHHENGIPWDNRPDNITLLSREHHARLTRVRERHRTAAHNQNR